MANSIHDLIDAINDLINNGVDVRFIKDSIANDIELSQDPCGNWRFHVKEASAVDHYLEVSVSGVAVDSSGDLYNDTFSGVKEYIRGFTVWGNTDGMYDFFINGVRIARTQTGQTNYSSVITFPKPIIIEFGDVVILRVLNCADPGMSAGDYVGTIFNEVIP